MTARQRGLTLIELLVALAIFAVLGTLTYRGTTQTVNSGRLIEAELGRWREINRAVHIIETELLQIVAPKIPKDSQRLPALRGITVKGSKAGGSELNFLSLANPDSVERVAFRHIDGRLEWLRRPDLKPDGNATTIDTLLDNVTGVRWRFLSNRNWSEQWPVSATSPVTLPRAIELELTLPDAGVLRRLYAIH